MASPDVLLGAGLYETMRVSDGTALHGERHLERMRSSALALGLPPPEREAFACAIAEAPGEGEVVRVILTAAGAEPELGVQRRAALAPEPQRLTLLRGWYAPGYTLREHKLTSHFHGVQGRRLAQADGYDDALLIAHDGRVGEATNANVALVVGGVLVTPSVDGLLPGVCRAALLEAARAAGLRVVERPVALDDIADADGVLLTSSPRGVSEAVEFDGREVRRVTPDLLAALREGVAAAARAHALALP
jgi:branched-subunit amino acid aminotransferase/4-amino-4-deoxychorismate lyase